MKRSTQWQAKLAIEFCKNGWKHCIYLLQLLIAFTYCICHEHVMISWQSFGHDVNNNWDKLWKKPRQNWQVGCRYHNYYSAENCIVFPFYYYYNITKPMKHLQSWVVYLSVFLSKTSLEIVFVYFLFFTSTERTLKIEKLTSE